MKGSRTTTSFSILFLFNYYQLKSLSNLPQDSKIQVKKYLISLYLFLSTLTFEEIAASVSVYLFYTTGITNE